LFLFELGLDSWGKLVDGLLQIEVHLLTKEKGIAIDLSLLLGVQSWPDERGEDD